MPKPRRVAAGWYVGVGVTLLLAGVPQGFFSNPWFRGTLCVLGVISLCGAAYEWWFRKPETSDEAAPNVMLELSTIRSDDLSWEPVPILAYNAGSVAMNVQVDPLASGPWRGPTYGGDAETPAGPVIIDTKLAFGAIPHIRSGKRATVVLVFERGPQPGLWWFIDLAMRHQEYEGIAKATPLELTLRMTYWNEHRTKQWERAETLHYDPRTRRAHIAHGHPVEVSQS